MLRLLDSDSIANRAVDLDRVAGPTNLFGLARWESLQEPPFHVTSACWQRKADAKTPVRDEMSWA